MPDTMDFKAVAEASRVTSLERLEELYDAPRPNAVRIEMPALDAFTREFIANSPMVMIGTEGDVSSKGDDPGFVAILDDQTLLIPDRAGNNRIDTLQNILKNPTVGLLFLIPGVNECLRIGGRAEITDDTELLAPMVINGKPPRTGIIIHIEQVFYVCGRSIMRSKIWHKEAQLDRRAVPSPAQVIAARTGNDAAAMNEKYEQAMKELY
ncbi:MAG: MSMEG_1061 family FMN-dependent PPOX-type flavoprotein [Rhodospirillales bacterium]|jgi:PPOX class probable FMN-dependent enzyme